MVASTWLDDHQWWEQDSKYQDQDQDQDIEAQDQDQDS
jgi:hypothetical protein